MSRQRTMCPFWAVGETNRNIEGKCFRYVDRPGNAPPPRWERTCLMSMPTWPTACCRSPLISWKRVLRKGVVPARLGSILVPAVLGVDILDDAVDHAMGNRPPVTDAPVCADKDDAVALADGRHIALVAHELEFAHHGLAGQAQMQG